MKWLWKLIGAVPREEWDGIVLADEAARQVHYSGDVQLLLRGIREAVPGDATLYIESPKHSEVIDLLRANPAETIQKVQIGTIWPRDAAYHLPNEEHLIERLIDLAGHLAAPELADHLVVYRGDQVIISGYDLGDDVIWVSRELEDERFQRLLELVGGTEQISDSPPYRPINCALHDRLEALATVGRVVRIVARTRDGTPRVMEDRLVDVFAQGGEEFVRTAAGESIRLDRLESVDGVPFRPSAEVAPEARS